MVVLWKVALTLFVCYIIAIDANRARRRRRQIQGYNPSQYGYGKQPGLNYQYAGRGQYGYGPYGQYGQIPQQNGQIPRQYGSYYNPYASDSYSAISMNAYSNYRPAEYNFDPSYFWRWNDGQKQTSANVFTILLSLFLTLVICLITI